MKSPIKFLFAALFFTFQLYAQSNGSIKGTVVSSQNFPLEKVTVATQNAGFSTLTDKGGNYNISNVKPGNYTLIISHIGFTTSSVQVTVTSNSVTIVPKVTLAESQNTLSEVIVSGSVVNRTLANGKAGIKTIDLPQSIQVINSKTLEQQQTLRLSDVIKNVNGVYVGSARGGAQESFWSRGYDMSANNMFKNGFRSNSGSMPEVASLEQVEALKGSSALLFGNVAPGGIINMVTKTPYFSKGGSVSFQTGSNAFYKPTIDFYGPLNSTIAYRFIGSYENAESFRDVVTRDRIYVNPSLLFKVSKKTHILLQGDYLRDNWTPDFGTGAIGKELVDLPRNTYLGAKWSNGLTTQATFTGQISYKFHKNWKFSSNTSIQDFGRKSEGTERIQPSANGTLNRPYGKNKNTELITAQQFNLQGTVMTGSVKHQLSTGVDTDYSFGQAYTYAFDTANYDQINIYDPSTYENDNGSMTGARNSKIVRTETNRFGGYAQDLISLSDKFKVLAGIRWSWQEAQAINYNEKLTAGVQEYTPENDPNPKKDAKRIDAAFSPKAGLVYQPTKNTSLFASYANSFTPNTGIGIDKQPLEASIIDQFEVGVKKEFWNGILTTNITLYQIVNNNLAQMAEFDAEGAVNSNSQMKILSGETKSKGVEVDVNVKPIEGLSILAGYSYNDMRFSDTEEGIVGSFIEGDRVARTPAHTANLSFFYTVPSGKLKGLSFGSIANYIGDRIGGWNRDYAKDPNTNQIFIRDREIPISGYTTIDVSAGYTWRQFSILCRLSNITNELNYTVHENYSVNPIAPRQVMATLKYKF
ncbi:ferrichrome-iron receptor [Flavobacterium saliperosum S13]|uniref:Iron complex outermembrane recepter protein n=2 Tax=Flavobacterium saliperosum TaxID=329186 RepID=A0A1G4VRG9_9FLAO|nr:TonB-dependent receptor [Flavobacterium saliperosum]ESU24091.1 ferrichrome-iron receptor [Flavobacterium saliperosum S13]SCX10791.1 iron complex outermembrane recepter protein [Flavobacterium saliperosum]